MCKECDKQVIEMGILESDLPNLPYKVLHQQCMHPGCQARGITIRDYGIAPFYWWAVKIVREEKWTPYYDYDKGEFKTEHRWRGGWFDASQHGHLCNRHWVKDWREEYEAFFHSGRNILDLIVELRKTTQSSK